MPVPPDGWPPARRPGCRLCSTGLDGWPRGRAVRRGPRTAWSGPAGRGAASPAVGVLRGRWPQPGTVNRLHRPAAAPFVRGSRTSAYRRPRVHNSLYDDDAAPQEPHGRADATPRPGRLVAAALCVGMGRRERPCGSDPAEATGARLLAVVAVCVSAGALWQLLYRRDLVDRLTHFSCAFSLVAVTVFALTWGDPVSSSMQAGVGLCAVLTGLVFAEQWLRSRDERAAHQRGSTSATRNTTATSNG
jgi:hypothetical protein